MTAPGGRPLELGDDPDETWLSVDAHCHVASEQFIPRSFVEGAVANIDAALPGKRSPARRARLTDLYLAKIQDPDCSELLAEMDEAGIERAVLLLPDFTHALPDCVLTIEEMCLRHRDLLVRHPERFHVLAGVDPRWGEDGVRLFERCVGELGFHGMKVYPPCGFGPSDRRLYPFYEICRAGGLPVVVHTGPTSPVLGFETGHPFLLDQAARDFPEIPFVLAHGAVSFQEESVMLCAFRPNVFLDLSGIQHPHRPGGSSETLRGLLGRGISHKMLFGTDFPVFRLQGSQRELAEVLLGGGEALAGASRAELRRIFRDNVLSLLPERSVGGPRSA